MRQREQSNRFWLLRTKASSGEVALDPPFRRASDGGCLSDGGRWLDRRGRDCASADASAPTAAVQADRHVVFEHIDVEGPGERGADDLVSTGKALHGFMIQVLAEVSQLCDGFSSRSRYVSAMVSSSKPLPLVAS